MLTRTLAVKLEKCYGHATAKTTELHF